MAARGLCACATIGLVIAVGNGQIIGYSCPDSFEHRIELAKEQQHRGSFSYTVVQDDGNRGGDYERNDGILCGRLEIEEELAGGGEEEAGWLRWIGFGISPDGQMIGSEAILGVPSHSKDSKDSKGGSVYKYKLDGKSDSLVRRLPPAQQTLINATASLQHHRQAGARTVLSFVKLLEEPPLANEWPILLQGTNHFLFAYGTIPLNPTQPHDDFVHLFSHHSFRGGIPIDFYTPQPPSSSSSSQPPYYSPQVKSNDCSTNFCSMQLSPNLHKRYKITLPPNYHPDDTDCWDCKITIQLTYQGLAWIGFGLTHQDGSMIGSHVVIGQPQLKQPQKYRLDGKSYKLVQKLSLQHQQTLLSSTIEFINDETIMEFTMDFRHFGSGNNVGGESNKNTMIDNSLKLNLWDNTHFLWAHGDDGQAELDYHGINKASYTLPTLLSQSKIDTLPNKDDTNDIHQNDDNNSNSNSNNDNHLSPKDVIDCTIQFCEKRLSPQLKKRFKITLPTLSDGSTMAEYDTSSSSPCLECKITIQLILDGLAWIGIGVSHDGNMIGSHVIIGQPMIEEDQPKKYHLGGKSFKLVTPLSDVHQQSLMNANTVYDINNDQTIMTFTITFRDFGSQHLHLNLFQQTHFIWAHGEYGQKTISFHGIHKASYVMDALAYYSSPFSSGSDQEGNYNTNNSNNNNNNNNNRHYRSFQKHWAIHGILAFVAWGICAPLAISCAVFREYSSYWNIHDWFERCFIRDTMSFPSTSRKKNGIVINVNGSAGRGRSTTSSSSSSLSSPLPSSPSLSSSSSSNNNTIAMNNPSAGVMVVNNNNNNNNENKRKNSSFSYWWIYAHIWFNSLNYIFILIAFIVAVFVTQEQMMIINFSSIPSHQDNDVFNSEFNDEYFGGRRLQDDNDEEQFNNELDGEGHWHTFHAKLGLTMVLLASFQFFGGYLRPKSSSTLQSLLYYSHGSGDDGDVDVDGNFGNDASDDLGHERINHEYGESGNKSNSNSSCSSSSSSRNTNGKKSLKNIMTIRQLWGITHAILGMTLYLCSVWQMHQGMVLYRDKYSTSRNDGASSFLSVLYIIWMGMWSGIIVGGSCWKWGHKGWKVFVSNKWQRKNGISNGVVNNDFGSRDQRSQSGQRSDYGDENINREKERNKEEQQLIMSNDDNVLLTDTVTMEMTSLTNSLEMTMESGEEEHPLGSTNDSDAGNDVSKEMI